MEGQTTYNLVLQSTIRQQNGTNTPLSLSSPPLTVRDLKLEIEKSLQIPAATQTLTWQAARLQDDEQVETLRLRDQDTLTVSYYSKAECTEVGDCIKWIKHLLGTFKFHGLPLKGASLVPHLQEVVSIIAHEERCFAVLGYELFLPWNDPMKYTNKLYFKEQGGLQMVMELYGLLTSHPWHQLPIKMKILECEILCALWNFAESMHLRRAIIELGGLDMCITSFLRATIEPFISLRDRSLEPGEHMYRAVLKEAIRASLGTLSNLCELQEVHVSFASNEQAMQQLFSIILCPTFDSRTLQLVTIVLLVLSYSTQTHPHLIIEQGMAQRLVMATNINQKLKSFEKQEQSLLLTNYHRAMLFAQVVIMSPCVALQSEEETACIHKYLTQFMATADHLELREAEEDESYIWATFLPYIRLLYQPVQPQTDRQREILERSREVTVVALQNMLGQAKHRSFLVQEGLLEYTMCLPWHLEGGVRERAEELVRMMYSCDDITMQPASLLSMSKAVTAKSFCGLEKVLQSTVPELLSELYDS